MNRTRAGVLALLVAAVAALPASLLSQAAADESDLVTTASTRTVAWADQGPRHPGDEAPEVFDALKNWRLRVSQTKGLLNQTVQVSWAGGGRTGNSTFLQLMQCWSDGPTVSPVREQCAYGGIDRDGADGTGGARTRQLGDDPRERTHLDNGNLVVVTVDGGTPTKTWADAAQLVLGTVAKTCVSGSQGYLLRLVPPRGSPVPPVVVDSVPDSLPASLTRVVNGFTRVYPAVAPAHSMAQIAAAAGVATLPPGVYRLQLQCIGAGGAVTTSFAGWLGRSTASGPWQLNPHEGGAFVPFDPLGDGPEDSATDLFERDQVLEYIKPRSTNEVWNAKNDPAGGGDTFMEVFTDLEAQHLGCGRVQNGAPRSCWLVAVPRWAGDPTGPVETLTSLASPLSQTLWDRRIEVPLEFAPVASGCKIGSGLKQILAHDAALSALRSWQPTFCGDSSTANSVLGPLDDFSVRLGLSAPNRMGVVGVPEEGLETSVVAPLATSGVVIGFSVDRRIPYGAAGYDLNGTRITELNLNARLVAKLLTQSYDSGAAPNGGRTSGYNGSTRNGGPSPLFFPARSFPADNPRTLYDDPEFLGLNPEFAAWIAKGAFLPQQDMADLIVAAGDTDAYQTLWRWMAKEPAARAFLGGEADADGMRVNPYYKGQLTEATSTFPMLDPTCIDDIADPDADSFPLLCQINQHPRVEDDSEAAQAAVRGDTKRVNVAPLVFDSLSTFKAEPRQEQGRHGLLVITNSAVAARYGLPTASLRNASGTFAQATATSLAAARSQMTKRTDGVLLPAPEEVNGAGYPLTTMSYAVVDVAATTQAQNDAFAEMLDYAAGTGQQPGTAVGFLPPGYAPLSPTLVAQAGNAIAVLRDPSALLEQPAVVLPTPTPSTPEPVAQAPEPVEPVVSVGPVASVGSVGPVVNPPVVPRATATVPAPQIAVRASATTASSTPLHWLLPSLLLGALLAGLAGRVLLTVGADRPLISGAVRVGGSTPTAPPLPPES